MGYAIGAAKRRPALHETDTTDTPHRLLFGYHIEVAQITLVLSADKRHGHASLTQGAGQCQAAHDMAVTDNLGRVYTKNNLHKRLLSSLNALQYLPHDLRSLPIFQCIDILYTPMGDGHDC